MNQTVYMDYNATAPVRPEARDAMVAALAAQGNPSSVHRLGRLARRSVEDARDGVRKLAGAADDARVVFTSGGTEAAAIALRGCARIRFFASAVEHPCVRAVRDDIEFVPVNGDGVIDLGRLDAMLGDDASNAVVSVMLANNETGVLQPVAEVVALAHKKGALVHTDAVQAAGKIAIDFSGLGVDYMTFSAHKFGGPQGVGALVCVPNAPITAQVAGGGQEAGIRGGTENVPGIAAMAAAAEASFNDLSEETPRLAALRDELENQMRERNAKVCYIGADAERLPNTSLAITPGVSSETLVAGLDLAGFCVSAGSACASGKVKLSPVLAAMGVNEKDAASAVRISLGAESDPADIDRFVRAWNEICQRAQGDSSTNETESAA